MYIKKNKYVLVFFILFLCSCSTDKIRILNDGYLGMTVEEYNKVFKKHHTFKTKFGNIKGELKPVFSYGHLIKLDIKLEKIYNSNPYYELMDLLKDKYGSMTKKEESKKDEIRYHDYNWKKGRLDIKYNYTSYGKYIGYPNYCYGYISYSSDYKFNKQFQDNYIKKISKETKSNL